MVSISLIELTRHDGVRIRVNANQIVQIVQEEERTIIHTTAPGPHHHMISVREKADRLAKLIEDKARGL